jgi:hypothetical protein
MDHGELHILYRMEKGEYKRIPQHMNKTFAGENYYYITPPPPSFLSLARKI